MITDKQFIAFDLGSSRITAMAAEIKEGGEIKIISSESKPSDDIKFGVVEQHTGAAFKVNELQKLLQNSSKISEISMVSTAVGAKSMKIKFETVSRFVGKPNVITDKLLADMLEECEKKVSSETIEVFDTIPISYHVDGIRMDEPVGKMGSQIIGSYHVIVGNASIKTQRDRCFEKTGLVLESTPLAVEALSTVLLEEHDKMNGCALIDFGAETTTLAVYHDDVIQNLLVVPLGAKHITKDIEELGISEAHAERLKCIKGCALESKVDTPIYVQIPSKFENAPMEKISTSFLARIIEARLEEILQPIFDIIDGLSFKLEGGIVLTGGGSKLAHLSDFIYEKLGVQPRFGSHADWISDDTPEQYLDTIYSKLVGVIVLTNEYRKEHPVELTIVDPVKNPKLPKKSNKLVEKIGNKMFSFFEDDNTLD